MVERIDYNLVFHWFVGLGIDDPVWNHSTFSKNRDRLMPHNIDEMFFDTVKKQAHAKKLMSRDHFTVDGTLLDACAGMKSFKPASPVDDDSDDSGSGENFHGEKRSNAAHESSTDPDARLYRKGKGNEAKLSFMGHLLTENRNGLIVDAEASVAGTSQEWDSSVTLLANQSTRPGQTVGADKGYDTNELVEGCRGLNITPHVAAKIDGRTLSSDGYRTRQRKRKHVEECIGWMKTFGLMHKLCHRGLINVGWQFRFTAAAYNIIRLKALLA